MNFALFKQSPPKTLIYNIRCYNDMGHFVYSSSCGKTFMDLPTHIGDFMYQLRKKYVDVYYKKHNINDKEYTTIGFKLKPGLQKKFQYRYLHNGDIYVLNVTYDI
jgi:hypothetical protein